MDIKLVKREVVHIIKILVLGATGFLGSTLLGFAKNMGYNVLGTSRYDNANANILKLDTNDKYAVEHFFTQYCPDIIVWTLLSRENEDILINAGLTNLLSAMNKDTKLIFISTDGVFTTGEGNYAESDKLVPLPEEAPLANYVNSKIAGEKKIQEAHQNHIIIRTGPLYGRDLNNKIEKRTQRVIDAGEKGYRYDTAANLYKSFVHVEDLSKAIMELILMDFKGVLHMGPTQKESYFTFYKKRLKGLGYSTNVLAPTVIRLSDHPYIALDTSLNTEKANSILGVRFRNVCVQ